MLIPFVVVISCLTPASEYTTLASASPNTATPSSTSGYVNITMTDANATTASSSTNSTASWTPTSIAIVQNQTQTNKSEEPTTFNPYPAYSMPPNVTFPTTGFSFPTVTYEDPSPSPPVEKIQTSSDASSSTFISHLPYLVLNLFFGLCFFVLS